LVEKPDVDLLMLAVGDNIFRVGENLLLISYFSSSPIIVDIEKHIQSE
jgi:hypothetical protein